MTLVLMQAAGKETPACQRDLSVHHLAIHQHQLSVKMEKYPVTLVLMVDAGKETPASQRDLSVHQLAIPQHQLSVRREK